jgi:hypothetical protein
MGCACLVDGDGGCEEEARWHTTLAVEVQLSATEEAGARDAERAGGAARAPRPVPAAPLVVRAAARARHTARRGARRRGRAAMLRCRRAARAVVAARLTQH